MIFDTLILKPSRQIKTHSLKLERGNKNRQVFVKGDIIFHNVGIKTHKICIYLIKKCLFHISL